MKTSKINIKLIDLYTYLIFIALFKMYFIPTTMRQIFKIGVLLCMFVYLVDRLKKKEIFNLSLILSLSMVASGLINYIIGDYSLKALLDSLLYALSFYDFYTLILYGSKYGYGKRMGKCLYNINLLYCILTIISVIVVGTENNSNVSSYLFGNKFISAYLYISLIALYGMSHDMNRKRNRNFFYILIVFSMIFSIYIGCATATVSLAIAGIIYIFSREFRVKFFCKPIVVTLALIGTALVPLMLNLFLKIDFIYNIIFGIFKRSYTVYGRFEIYQKYLFQLIKQKPVLGYGYSNGKMLEVSGVFGNAQNGLLEQLMTFGIIGVGLILFFTFYCVKKAKFDLHTICMIILLYSMIIAAVFEVTINWFFWMALFMIRWNNGER